MMMMIIIIIITVSSEWPGAACYVTRVIWGGLKMQEWTGMDIAGAQ